jgi:hypothetical protein
MKPLPVTVSVCEEDPATRLAGVMDVMPGVGFAVGVGVGVGVGGDVLAEEPDPPPQPDKAINEPRHKTRGRRNKLLRINNPPENLLVQEVLRRSSLLPQAVFACGLTSPEADHIRDDR